MEGSVHAAAGAAWEGQGQRQPPQGGRGVRARWRAQQALSLEKEGYAQRTDRSHAAGSQEQGWERQQVSLQSTRRVHCGAGGGIVREDSPPIPREEGPHDVRAPFSCRRSTEIRNRTTETEARTGLEEQRASSPTKDPHEGSDRACPLALCL